MAGHRRRFTSSRDPPGPQRLEGGARPFTSGQQLAAPLSPTSVPERVTYRPQHWDGLGGPHRTPLGPDSSFWRKETPPDSPPGTWGFTCPALMGTVHLESHPAVAVSSGKPRVRSWHSGAKGLLWAEQGMSRKGTLLHLPRPSQALGTRWTSTLRAPSFHPSVLCRPPVNTPRVPGPR